MYSVAWPLNESEAEFYFNLIETSLLSYVNDTFLVLIKPGFHIVLSVVYVVRKKFIGQIEFILSRTASCICRFFCIAFVREVSIKLYLSYEFFFVRQTRQIQRYGNQPLVRIYIRKE